MAPAKPPARTLDKSLQALFDQRIVRRQSELWKTYDEKLGSHGVSRDISDLTQVSVLEKELERVVKAEDNLSKTRKYGVHQIGARVQTFATNLQAFLRAYSGLLDIAEAADDHFSGGLAIKALSLLLVVAVNKNAKEAKINDILEDSMKCFPRLEGYRHIYQDEILHSEIKNLINLITDFARTSALYYERSTFRRIIEAVVPRTITIDLKASAMKSSLIDIKDQVDFLLSTEVVKISNQVQDLKKADEISQAKIDELQRTLDESQKTINSLKKANDALLAKKREASILKLRRDLKVSDASFDLTDYQSLLERRFARNGKTTYSELKDLLFTESAYTAWSQAQNSCLLLLTGRISGGSHNHAHCWLSLATLGIIQRLRAENNSVALYICQKTDEFAPEDEIKPVSLVGSLIYQVFSWHTDLIDNPRMLDTIEIVQASNSENEMLQNLLVLMYQLFEELSKVGNGPSYFVIDRIDRCVAKSQVAVMDVLLQLLKISKGVVKFIVVSNETFWDPSEAEVKRILCSNEIENERCWRRLRWSPVIKRRVIED